MGVLDREKAKRGIVLSPRPSWPIPLTPPHGLWPENLAVCPVSGFNSGLRRRRSTSQERLPAIGRELGFSGRVSSPPAFVPRRGLVSGCLSKAGGQALRLPRPASSSLRAFPGTAQTLDAVLVQPQVTFIIACGVK